MPIHKSPALQSVMIAGVCLCHLFAAGCAQSEPEDILAQANDALDFGRYDEALELAAKVPESDPRWLECQYILGRASLGKGDRYLALQKWQAIPREDNSLGNIVGRARAELYLMQCDFSEAVDELEFLAANGKTDIELCTRLAALFNACGLRSRAEPFMQILLKSPRINMPDLVAYSEPGRPYGGPAPFSKCAKSMSSDPYVLMWQALQDINSNDVQAAKKRLLSVVDAHPEWGDAQALLGELSLESDPVDFGRWNAGLSDVARGHADVLFVQGLWAKQAGHPKVAARCFLQTVQHLPHHGRAMFQLARTLRELGHERAEWFEERADAIRRCSSSMERVLVSQGQDAESFQMLISLLYETGREAEGTAWANMALDRFGPKGWISDAKRAVRNGHPAEQVGPQPPAANILDIEQWPTIETLSAQLEINGDKLISSARAQGAVRFRDVAKQIGIQFTYFQSPDTVSNDVRIFESTGGGVGVLDFDGDLAADIFLTQGHPWPRGKNTPAPAAEYQDLLYRNRGASAGFQVVHTGIAADKGYGQGCTAGDFNNDGFVDLYVANIGSNQLLLNNGDGTFSDVTSMAGINAEAWTTSCLMIDLNNDGNPDMYDVNYLQGDSIFTVECGANRCSVSEFEGAEDHVWLSQGDGQFVRVADAAPKHLAKGLGIVALFSKDQRGPSLFIANDQVPNFLLQPTERNGVYLDVAVESGIAVNMSGAATAAMGVAAGDVDGDRRVDLFVTNFEHEANCLYFQREAGMFHDGVVATGLKTAGMPYVGWGTQFLDSTNSGKLDLVVANGHVADFRTPGVECNMPLQFFMASASGWFTQLEARDLGPLFSNLTLGRSVATLDWNRDGRLDFVVSNIASPVVVAQNESTDPGNWLQIQLHARDSARDACGAELEVEIDDQIFWKQLSAGDGYQACNERLIHFGLADAAQVTKLKIDWPSGSTTVIDSVPVNSLLVCTEGLTTVTCASAERMLSLPATIANSE